MRLAMIVAMARNRVIGRNNKLPWYLPEDLPHFKRTTMGKPLIMGRKTFESIGRPLPGRVNIVLTRNPDWSAPGVSAVTDLHKGLQQARAQAELDGVEDIMIIGGGHVYESLLPLTDRLYMTQVHAEIPGDAFFPAIDWDQWQEVSREDFAGSEKNPHDYSLVVYDRRTGKE